MSIIVAGGDSYSGISRLFSDSLNIGLDLELGEVESRVEFMGRVRMQKD